MIIKQLSVFLENKKGRLAAVMSELAGHNIDVSALSLADTTDFGVLRLIVNRPEEAKRVLTDSGVTVRITDMVATVMADRPGGAAEVVSLLSDADIAIEYMYACTGRVGGKALVVMRVDDIEKAEAILSAGGFAAAPDEAIAVDVSFAMAPGLKKEKCGKLGGGAMIGRSS